MSSVCSVCGRPADRFRDVVRVVGMKVEIVCQACARANAGGPATPRAGINDLPRTKPTEERQRQAAPTAHIPKDKPAPRRSETLALVLLGFVALGTVAVALVVRSRKSAPPPTPAPQAAAAPEKPRVASATAGDDSNFDVPPPAGLTAVLEGAWTHPLAGPFRDMPTHEQRRFGAYRGREHYRNRYCGSGHCGVDLGYQVGLPVLAARDGVIEKVVRDPTDVEGKYIKVQHPGGLRTYYMHLNEAAPELDTGTPVKAGQMIGTLGRTGIKVAEPHLHFMISFEQGGKELFVDPEPLMAKARLVEVERLPSWAAMR
jgi:murein DD-endopeptidase MepM/ murein hydrolase activator NlpD